MTLGGPAAFSPESTANIKFYMDYDIISIGGGLSPLGPGKTVHLVRLHDWCRGPGTSWIRTRDRWMMDWRTSLRMEHVRARLMFNDWYKQL